MKQKAEQVDYRLGELLIDLGVTSREEVDKGLRVSGYTDLPLGKTLVMLDSVPDKLVKSAVEAQSMLRDRLLEMKQARKAIGIVKRKNWDFADALVSLGVDASATKGTRLGELLRDAGAIDAEQLELGLKISDYSGLPLGQVMVLLSKVTEDKIRISLALQRELRASNIERKDAILKLKRDRGADATVTDLPAATHSLLTASGAYAALLASGANAALTASGAHATMSQGAAQANKGIQPIDDQPVQDAAQIAPVREDLDSSGSWAVQSEKEYQSTSGGWANSETGSASDESKEDQSTSGGWAIVPPPTDDDSGVLSFAVSGAYAALSTDSVTPAPPANPKSRPIKLGELLVAAEVMSGDEIEHALNLSKVTGRMLGEVLLRQQHISEDLLTAALRLQSMLWTDQIGLEKAVGVLREANRLAGSQIHSPRIANTAGGDSENITLFEFMKITGYLSKSRLNSTIEKVMDDPRLMAVVMKFAQRIKPVSDRREAIEVAFTDGPTLRFVVNETNPRERSIVDSALIFHQLVEEGRLTLCQALVNFSIKINGIDSDIIRAHP